MYSAKVWSLSKITCFDLIRLSHIHSYVWVIHFNQLDFDSIEKFHVDRVRKRWLLNLVRFYHHSPLVYVLRLSYHYVMFSRLSHVQVTLVINPWCCIKGSWCVLDRTTQRFIGSWNNWASWMLVLMYVSLMLNAIENLVKSMFLALRDIFDIVLETYSSSKIGVRTCYEFETLSSLDFTLSWSLGPPL